MSEQTLLFKLQSGDEKATAQCYKDCFNVVRWMVLKNSGDEDSARSLYTDAFMAFLDALKKPGFTLTTNIQGYIYSIARNLWLKELRKNKRVVLNFTDYESFVEVAEEPTGGNVEDCIERIEKLMSELAENHRKTLFLFYFKEKGLKEITEALGYKNTDTTKNQRLKGMKRLQALARKAGLRKEDCL